MAKPCEISFWRLRKKGKKTKRKQTCRGCFQSRETTALRSDTLRMTKAVPWHCHATLLYSALYTHFFISFPLKDFITCSVFLLWLDFDLLFALILIKNFFWWTDYFALFISITLNIQRYVCTIGLRVSFDMEDIRSTNSPYWGRTHTHYLQIKYRWPEGYKKEPFLARPSAQFIWLLLFSRYFFFFNSNFFTLVMDKFKVIHL